MSVSLHPRHPSVVSAEQHEKLKRRPSITFRRGPNPMLTIAPAIITALAVYIGLVYVDKIARRVATSAGQNGQSQETLVRDVDGVVDYVPIIERTPPPSPEALLEERARARAAAEAAPKPRPPTLIPELEPEPLPLPRLSLEPLEAPPLPEAGATVTP